MARTVKPDEYAAKRGEILAAAQRLVVTRGYERIAIQDILDELHISGGAFHHYFDSRGALLKALIERMLQNSEQPLIPIVRDPQLPALEKLKRFFVTLDQLRVAHKTTVVELFPVWYADDNAIVRQKMDEALIERRAPLLTEIIRQGIQEGVFSFPYPDASGEVILTLLQGMGNSHAKRLLSVDQEPDESSAIEGILVTYAAYMDAIERVLGAPAGTFYHLDAEVVKVWVDALRANP